MNEKQIWDDKQLTWKELEKTITELKKEIGDVSLPTFYITKCLPFMSKFEGENGEIVEEEIHCIQLPSGYWLSPKGADMLQELYKDEKTK